MTSSPAADLPRRAELVITDRSDRAEAEIRVVDRRPLTEAEIAALVDDVRAAAERAQLRGRDFHLAADHGPTALDPVPEAVADQAGLHEHRDLLQLRRSLPVRHDHPLRDLPALPTRPFASDDAAAWVATNNRAFAEHPDQGSQTTQTLADQQRETWYDPLGFLVADDPDRPGALAGFCWTKVHEATAVDPRMGEIYVIGVDPRHRGRRFGPGLVLAGLDHLAGLGVDTANLYVEADNGPAIALYEDLGFTVHARRRVYR